MRRDSKTNRKQGNRERGRGGVDKKGRRRKGENEERAIVGGGS